MPNYFPEGDAATPADTIEKSMAKVVSQLPSALDVLELSSGSGSSGGGVGVDLV
jgi:hypothetical protein